MALEKHLCWRLYIFAQPGDRLKAQTKTSASKMIKKLSKYN
jgi:hypothetical protein